MKAILMNAQNSKFVLKLSQRLDLRSSIKHIALQNLYIYYTWKDSKQQNKKSKLKIITSMWNDDFQLPVSSYSVSDIKDYKE